MRALEINKQVEPSYMTYQKGGFNIFGYELSPDRSDKSAPERVGSVSLELRFKKALPKTVVCVVLGMFFGSFHIDNEKEVKIFDDYVN